MMGRVVGLLLVGILVALGPSAHAGATTGLDPTAVPLLEGVVWLDDPWGWSATVADEGEAGGVRAWVHRTEAEAEARYLQELPEGAPLLPLGVEASAGNGVTEAWVREGLLVLRVRRPEGGAGDLAARLVAAAVDGGPWPAMPVARDGTWVVADPRWTHVSASAPPRRRVGALFPAPRRLAWRDDHAVRWTGDHPLVVRAWDAHGRGVRVRFEPEAPGEAAAD